MGIPETSFPGHILDNIGRSFGIGAVGGSAFHFLKGVHSSPKGARLVGGSEAVRMNAPRIGGSFAVGAGLFSTFNCSMVYLRQKEDHWNSIIAAAATGGFLQIRRGMGPASRSALFSGALWALLVGEGIMLKKVMSHPIFVEKAPSLSASTTTSWFGGFFGGGKEEEKSSGGVKTEILESYDSPIAPTFEYKFE
ncbi:hypothetical protein CASFOL_032509 [Castilleja foliolosa]|uniref:Uncharacterized protein n=1 Tax=Castilleja foliolosa TaxID=1961234 RepID=A0ABD3C1P8_9LAMI